MLQLLRYTAQWAGVQIGATADFTAKMIRLILEKMLSALGAMAAQALSNPARRLNALPLVLAGGWVLVSCSAL